MTYCDFRTLRTLRSFPGIAALALIGLGVGCSTTPATDSAEAPATVQSVGMVVTANPEATRAGVEILEAGGSAVDAAVAIEAVLSLVEPQSSGFAGGGFMVYRDAATGEITVYDGRETAPASVDPRQFVLEDGKPMGFLDAKNSGLSTGVPGVVDMLALAQGEQGALSWDVLLEPAIALAEGGFEVSPRLHGMLARFGRILPRTPEQGPTDAFDYFYDAEGNPHPVGYRLKNAAYAETLRALQADPRAINEGPIADAIVNAVGQAPRAGSMTRADLKAYRARKREPLCAPYQELTLCGPPPPASWVAVAMTLGILERGPAFSDAGAEDPSNWALFAEAQRLAYADRDFYVGDAAYVDVPIAGMLSDGYLAARAEQLDPEQAATTVLPGDPFAFQSASRGPMPGVDATLDVAGTTHFVVVDGDGNVVSMTATVESIFGSLRMVGGMFLNNQLTDFSFLPTDADGRPVANAVAGGKRPRSSMSPTIVLDDTGQFLLASGSPGGNSIIAYTAKSLLGVLEWGLSPAEAVALPNLVGRGDVVRLEKDLASPELIEALEAYGLEVDASRGENSGLSMVLRLPDGSLVGGADPRREGVVGRAAIPAD